MLKNIIYGNIGSVDRIMSRFQRTVDELYAVSSGCDSEATEVATQISNLRLKHEDLKAESAKASKIAGNLANLLK